MASFAVSDSTNFDTNDLWVQNSTVAQGETFAGLVSSTGNPVLGVQTQVYSDFTFTVGDLTYTYRGEWTIQYDRGLVTGSASASGYYDSIEVTRNGATVASYDGPQFQVDFGQTSQLLPLVDLLLGNVLPLLIGQAEQDTDGVDNLFLDSNPQLPQEAFANDDTINGGDGINHLFGYDGADRIYGGAAADTLEGGANDDALYGGLGADTLIGGTGFDTARYDDANYGNLRISLADPTINTGAAAGDTYDSVEGVVGGAGNDTIYGNTGNNKLYGMNGSDTFYGGLGADFFNGGAGIDYVRYDDANYGDLVLSLATPSRNTGAAAGDTYNQIEGLVGGAGNDLVGGNAFVNYLSGGAGNDRINGNSGHDVLTGGSGSDSFLFTSELNATSNVDRIRDFNAALDTIELSASVFRMPEKTGTLIEARFHVGTEATTKSQRIIYDDTTGALYYDADGNAAGEKIQFAQLDGAPSLTHNDFMFI